MSELGVVITGLGMVSSVGIDMIQTCASVRAGINRFRENPGYVCKPEDLDWVDPEPYVGAAAPWLEHAPYEERIEALLLDALQDLIRNSGMTREALAGTGVCVSLPAHVLPETALLEGRISDLFRKAAGGKGAPPTLFTSGHAGGFDALANAVSDLRQGKYKACIVAGADSYHDSRILAKLDSDGRLKSKRNKDGFIPGEGASALLVETRAGAQQRKASILAVLSGLGLGRESATVNSDRPSSGRGLAQAIGMALSGENQPAEILWAAGDLNGESYRAGEWGLCQVALPAFFRALKHVWHPADATGDVGAASGPMLVSLVARAFERGYARADRCLIFGSSDGEARGAIILQADNTEKMKQ